MHIKAQIILCTIKILIIAHGHLLESLPIIKREVGIYYRLQCLITVGKNFEIFKFSSDDHHIDIRNRSIY